MAEDKGYAKFIDMGFPEILKASQDLSNDDKEKLISELFKGLPIDFLKERMVVILSANNVFNNSVNFQVEKKTENLEQVSKESLIKILDSLAKVIGSTPDA